MVPLKSTGGIREPRSFTEAGASITSLGIPNEVDVQTLAESRSRLGLTVADFEISVEVEGEGRIGRFAPEEEMAAPEIGI